MLFWDDSGISWTICKQCAPCCRQITTQTHHRSVFIGRMLFLMHDQQCQSQSADKVTKITTKISNLFVKTETKNRRV